MRSTDFRWSAFLWVRRIRYVAIFAKKPFGYFVDKFSGNRVKQTIHSGAYGWRHRHWSGTFYPPELPVDDDEDWRLSYYSNEFNAVLVPADYWQGDDCDNWLDSVHADFRFFVECHASLLEQLSPAGLSDALQRLQPQLSALVFLDKNPPMSPALKKIFVQLADSLGVELLDMTVGCAHFAFIEDDLSDLRASRETVEQFAAQSQGGVASSEATIIVDHAQLRAGDLGKFRTMLEIMGF